MSPRRWGEGGGGGGVGGCEEGDGEWSGAWGSPGGLGLVTLQGGVPQGADPRV